MLSKVEAIDVVEEMEVDGVEETIVAVVELLVGKVEVVVIATVVVVVIVVVVNRTVGDVVITAVVEAVVVELVVVNCPVMVVFRVELTEMGKNPEAFFKIFSQILIFWAKEFCVKKMTRKNGMKNFMMGLGADVNYSRF